VKDHIEDVLDMVEIGSGANREVENVRLSRRDEPQVRLTRSQA
jgi:hypothetical protein